MNRYELKLQAKEQIKGNIGILLVISVIIYAISFASSLILAKAALLNLLFSFLVMPAFSVSIALIYLNLTNNVKPTVSDTFKGFDNIWGAVKVNFFVGLFTFLWSLLLVVPGIIKSISYSFAFYILAENKDKDALWCIKESQRITQGHKWELFVLGLSFIGWIFLGSLTLGIAFIWIIPYMSATYTNAYNLIKTEKADYTQTAFDI